MRLPRAVMPRILLFALAGRARRPVGRCDARDGVALVARRLRNSSDQSPTWRKGASAARGEQSW